MVKHICLGKLCYDCDEECMADDYEHNKPEMERETRREDSRGKKLNLVCH
jgi:hypothetical protein